MAPNGFLRRARAGSRWNSGAAVQESLGSRKYGGTLNYRNRCLSSRSISFPLRSLLFQRSADHQLHDPISVDENFSPRRFFSRPCAFAANFPSFANNLGDISVTSAARATSLPLSSFPAFSSLLVHALAFAGDFSSCPTRSANCRPAQSIILFARFTPGSFSTFTSHRSSRKAGGNEKHPLCIFGP